MYPHHHCLFPASYVVSWSTVHGGVTREAGGERWTGNTPPIVDAIESLTRLFVVVPSSGRANSGFAKERKLVVASVGSGVSKILKLHCRS